MLSSRGTLVCSRENKKKKAYSIGDPNGSIFYPRITRSIGRRLHRTCIAVEIFTRSSSRLTRVDDACLWSRETTRYDGGGKDAEWMTGIRFSGGYVTGFSRRYLYTRSVKATRYCRGTAANFLSRKGFPPPTTTFNDPATRRRVSVRRCVS